MIRDLFSKRMKRARGEVPDVYQFHAIPRQLRVQIVHVWMEAFDTDSYSPPHTSVELFDWAVKSLRKEFGVFRLTNNYHDSTKPWAELFDFFLKAEVEQALDCIEVVTPMLEIVAPEYTQEINERFREHGVGFQVEGDTVIRLDSEFLHQEAVKPALLLLDATMYSGANEEFRKAHEHYRHKRYKECLVDCLKAFESTMKAICDTRRWHYEKTATAQKLIAIILNNGLLPPYSETQLTSVRQQLESGIPTVRNKNGGHGQGSIVKLVPEYLARYQLNLTATTIVLLAEAHADIK